MSPSASVVKRTPSSTAFGSLTDADAGVTVLAKPPHGHAGKVVPAPVVNDQLKFAASALPAASLTRGSLAPPRSSAV